MAQFIVHASLDIIEELSSTTQSMFSVIVFPNQLGFLRQ